MSALFIGVAETIGRNLAQELLEPLQARFGDQAFLLELRLGQVAAGVLNDLAARDLHPERAFEPKHEVEEVDRLGIQALDQRHVESSRRPHRRRAHRR